MRLSSVDKVFKGGKIYFCKSLVEASIAIDDGKIVAIGNETRMPPADEAIDATRKILLPGLIDTHAHFRDPGFTHKEDFETGTKAAAAGGVTLVVDMPNTEPPVNTAERFITHRENAKKKAVVDFSHNVSGTSSEEIPKIALAGPPMGFKIFMMSDVGRDYPHMPGIGVTDHSELLRLFEVIAKTNIPCLLHPWDQQIWNDVSKRAIASGNKDYKAYAKAVREHDSIILNLAIAVAVELQRVTKVKLHLLHMSSRRGFDIVKQARAQGQQITTEVNPHDIFLSNDWKNIEKLGPYSIGWWVPKGEGEATWEALVNGEADVIATDHAPHTKTEKETGWKDMWKAPGGTPSIEWYLSLLLNEVNNKRLPLQRLVELTSSNPSKIFCVWPRKGVISIGSDADLTMIDMKRTQRLDDQKIYSKCGWNPYAGRVVKGVPIMTVVRGNVVMKDGVVIGKPGYGNYVSPMSQHFTARAQL